MVLHAFSESLLHRKHSREKKKTRRKKREGETGIEQFYLAGNMECVVFCTEHISTVDLLDMINC